MTDNTRRDNPTDSRIVYLEMGDDWWIYPGVHYRCVLGGQLHDVKWISNGVDFAEVKS